tara:strand:+ start:731 stop:871 length:141 start_codon:yes stop_codon:yes gene_type:complete
MIGQLLELLKLTQSNGQFSKIAKGKYKLPETFDEAYQQFKKDLKNG